MSEQPSVILSGFGDEAANQKTAEQQFSAFAALGLQYYSIRFRNYPVTDHYLQATEQISCGS